MGPKSERENSPNNSMLRCLNSENTTQTQALDAQELLNPYKE